MHYLCYYHYVQIGSGGVGGGGGQLKCVNDVSSGHEYMYMHALSMHAILKVGLIVMRWWWRVTLYGE